MFMLIDEITTEKWWDWSPISTVPCRFKEHFSFFQALDFTALVQSY